MVTAGVAITVAPDAALRLPAGDQEYDTFPLELAARLAVAPAQTTVEDETLTPGKGLTITVINFVGEQVAVVPGRPAVPVTVYV